MKTTTFGAFVNLVPGRDGLVHISKLGSGKRLSSVEEAVKEGDDLTVLVEDIDPQGKISLKPVGPEWEAPEGADTVGRRRESGATAAADRVIAVSWPPRRPGQAPVVVPRRRRRPQRQLSPNSMPISRTEFSSGLRVVTERMPGIRSVSIGFWVLAGSRTSGQQISGHCHFLEHLLFKGTDHRTALDIAEAFDAVGGDVNAFTAKEYTCYYARVLDRDLEMAVDHLADMLQHSTIRGGRPLGRVPRDPVRDRHARRLARGPGARRVHRGRSGRGTRSAARSSARKNGSAPRRPRRSAGSTGATTCPGASWSRRPATSGTRSCSRCWPTAWTLAASPSVRGADRLTSAVDARGRRSPRGATPSAQAVEQAHIVLGTNGLARTAPTASRS